VKKNWRPLFNRFGDQLRIMSKEVSSGLDPRGVKIKPWTSQVRLLDTVMDGLADDIHDFTCLKSRQLGITTEALRIGCFWLAVHPGIIGALVVDSEENRDTFREVMRRYVTSLPANFLGNPQNKAGRGFTIVKGGDNRSFMKFSNGARLDFLVAGKSKANWGESRGYSLAICSEVAKYGNPDGLASFKEGLAEHNEERLFIYESTANGMNHWRDHWIEAGRDIHTKRRVFVGWWSKSLNAIERTDRRFMMYGLSAPDERERELIERVREDYSWEVTDEQLAWYRWKASNEAVSSQSLEQNNPWYAEQAFVLSGFSFFQTRKIQERWNEIINGEPIYFEGFRFWLGNDFFAGKMESITDNSRLHEVELRVWEQPVKGATYAIGADPAGGRNENGDRHSIQVLRCFADKVVQVAEYADNGVDTRQMAWILAYIAGAYKNCMINLEITGGFGHAVMTELDNIRNQLRAEIYNAKAAALGWTDFMSTARWYLYHKPDSPGAGYVYNWNSTFDAKNRLLSGFRDAHVTDALVIRSVHLLDEMAIVVQDGSTIGAPNKQKDDRMFACALATEAWNRWFRPTMIAEGYVYENAMRLERGEASAAENLISRLVQNTIKIMAEGEREDYDPNQAFLEERGLMA
jgi:hypothetical protein